jgi:hypothetical protein
MVDLKEFLVIANHIKKHNLDFMDLPKAKKFKFVATLNMLFTYANWHLEPPKGYVVGILFVFRGSCIVVIGHINRQLSVSFLLEINRTRKSANDNYLGDGHKLDFIVELHDSVANSSFLVLIDWCSELI